jgi:hypothetical protein
VARLTVVKDIGRYCSTDKDGYICNDSNVEMIGEDYLEVIKEVKRSYFYHLGPYIHSIYIRGSIPRGLGIKGVSDLDTIAILNKKPEELDLNWSDRVEKEINNQFDCVNGVELSFYYIEEILEDTTSFSIIPFMLKTHSVCIEGEDIKHLLPEYKADQSLANEHLINVKRQIEQAKSDLINNHDKADILDCCSWIMKIIVRAGLALVMGKEKLYTRDLYPAFKLFSKYFPEKEQDMKQTLIYAIEPIVNPQVITELLNGFCDWIIDHSEQWLKYHNPNKELNMKLLGPSGW